MLNILKYLDGTLPSKDRDKMALWLDTSFDNREQYLLIKKISENGIKAKDIRLFDEEKAWNELWDKLESDKQKVIGINSRRIVRIVSVAASLIFLYLAVNFLFVSKEPDYKEFVCVKEIDTVQLVDGSAVFIKKGAVLKHFTKLKKSDSIRLVELDGVADFDIAPNKNLPFVVKTTGGAGIKVLGTSFEIKSHSQKVEVENFEGLVRFYEWNDISNNLLVRKGEKAVFDGSKISYFRDKDGGIDTEEEMSGQYHKVEDVVDYILDRFDSRISTAPYADIKMEDRVFVNLNQSLESILTQLDATSMLKFRKICRNCYEISVLKSYH